MLGDDLEAVAIRRLQDPDNPLVHDVAHSGAILGGLSSSQIDTCKRHGKSPKNWLAAGENCLQSLRCQAADVIVGVVAWLNIRRAGYLRRSPYVHRPCTRTGRAGRRNRTARVSATRSNVAETIILAASFLQPLAGGPRSPASDQLAPRAACGR